MSGRYNADQPELAAAKRFVTHTAFFALLATLLSALFARQSLVSHQEAVLPWSDWAGVLALTILVFILPVYALIARIGFAFLKNTRNSNHRYAQCVIYGAVIAMSLCIAVLLVPFFQEGMYSLLSVIYSLVYLSIAACVGAAAGAITARIKGYEGDIRLGPPL